MLGTEEEALPMLVTEEALPMLGTEEEGLPMLEEDALPMLETEEGGVEHQWRRTRGVRA